MGTQNPEMDSESENPEQEDPEEPPQRPDPVQEYVDAAVVAPETQQATWEEVTELTILAQDSEGTQFYMFLPKDATVGNLRSSLLQEGISADTLSLSAFKGIEWQGAGADWVSAEDDDVALSELHVSFLGCVRVVGQGTKYGCADPELYNKLEHVDSTDSAVAESIGAEDAADAGEAEEQSKLKAGYWLRVCEEDTVMRVRAMGLNGRKCWILIPQHSTVANLRSAMLREGFGPVDRVVLTVVHPNESPWRSRHELPRDQEILIDLVKDHLHETTELQELHCLQATGQSMLNPGEAPEEFVCYRVEPCE